MFGIGNLPTGDKDPFALRRHALGVIRMLVERAADQSLGTLLKVAFASFDEAAISKELADQNKASGAVTFFAPETPELVSNFVYDRFAGSLREQGYSAQEVDAVISLRPQKLAEVAQRLAAVRAFAQLPEAPALAAANKRVGNILKKVEGSVEAKINLGLLQAREEQALADALNSVALRADSAWASGQFEENLKALAALKDPVDAFFDKVMVNHDDPAIRANRLGLLATLHQAMNRVADLSKLAA
jgi:glycyl-tRNA synthetase beta chain